MRLSKKWFIGLIICLFLGISVSFVGLILCGFDFSTLNFDKYKEKTYDITEEFSDIKINASTENINFALSEDGKCKVVCTESEKITFDVFVKDGTLNILLKDDRSWYDHIKIFDFTEKKLDVYLPQRAYNSIVIDVSTGDISIKDINLNGDLNINVSTGDITFDKVIVSGKINIESSTGDVKFVSSDASEIFIKTSTGSITGTLLSDKIFDCHTSTGDVNIPKIQSGGNCKITTSTGDINIKIE